MSFILSLTVHLQEFLPSHIARIVIDLVLPIPSISCSQSCGYFSELCHAFIHENDKTGEVTISHFHAQNCPVLPDACMLCRKFCHETHLHDFRCPFLTRQHSYQYRMNRKSAIVFSLACLLSALLFATSFAVCMSMCISGFGKVPTILEFNSSTILWLEIAFGLSIIALCTTMLIVGIEHKL
jgi:hypothetical protein